MEVIGDGRNSGCDDCAILFLISHDYVDARVDAR